MSSSFGCSATVSKTYWPIINRFFSKVNIRIYRVSLLTANSYWIFYKKAELFNQHFAAQRSIVQNACIVTVFNFKTNKRLKSFEINDNELLLIIRNINVNKGYGWDDIFIRMIQLWGKSIASLLKLFF